ncbi:MAG: hypothetical protein WB443_04510, partial [Nitrososphaeraceae archaeon]
MAQFQHSRFFYFSWQPMSPLHLLQVAVGFFTPDRNKKEVNQFAGLCDKQSPCMSGVLIFILNQNGNVMITISVQCIG